MLLLPAYFNKENKKYPFGLLILTALMIFTFVSFQLQDHKFKNDAIKYYFSEGLDKIEFPMYVRFIRKNMRNELYFNLFENVANGYYTENDIYWLQRNDPFFQTCLNTDKCLAPNSLYYLKWQEHRREYQHLLNKSGQQVYGYKTAEPTILNAFTSTLMQSDYLHLIVNVIFLFLIGALIESHIGMIGLILSYCLCAMITISVTCLFAPLSLIPIVGSTGGIAGLVGMVLVFNGLQSTRFNFVSLRGVGFFEVRSAYVLPLWILTQCALMPFTSFDRIDFIAMLFSMIGGMLFATLISHVMVRHFASDIISESNTYDFDARFNEAVNEISNLNYEKAKAILNQLLKAYPSNKEVLFQLFNITKAKPFSEEYHQVVQKIFTLKDTSKSSVATLNLVFKNYLRNAQPTIRFDSQTFLGLLQRFRKAGYYEDAEKILKVLIKHNVDDNMSEVLAREQLMIAKIYLERNDTVYYNRLIVSLIEHFPNTESAIQARNLVSHKDF